MQAKADQGRRRHGCLHRHVSSQEIAGPDPLSSFAAWPVHDHVDFARDFSSL